MHEYSKKYNFWIFIWIFNFLNIHCKCLHEYSHNIRKGYQGNAPGMDKEVWRKPERRLESWGLKVWEPLHVLRRDGKHVGWTWLVGSARATTAAALHFRGRCHGGAPPATRAALLVNTFFIIIHKCLEIEASHCWKHRLRSRKGGWWAAWISNRGGRTAATGQGLPEYPKISKNIRFQVEIFKIKNEYSCEYPG